MVCIELDWSEWIYLYWEQGQGRLEQSESERIGPVSEPKW